MAGFDLDSARQHYSDAQIADYLGQSRNFDTAGARKAGFSDQAIIEHVMGMGATPKAAPTQPEPDHTFVGDLGHNALGALENAGAAVANIPGSIINAGADFLARATGHTAGAHPVGMVQPGQAGREFGQRGADLLEQGIEAAGGGDVAAKGVGATDTAVRSAAEAHPALANGLAAASDVAQIAGARAGLRAPIAEGLPTLPAAVNRGVRGVTAATGDTAQAAAQAAQQAAWEKLGLKTGQGQGVAQAMAGASGKQALQLNNAQAGNAVAQGEAGVPHTQLLGADTLEAARAAPEGVFGRVAKAVPEGPLDQTASAAADAVPAKLANLATTSDNAKTTIQNIVERLKATKTGDQRLEDLRSLRQEGFKQTTADDVDTQAIGKAKLALADAVEGHIERAIPQGADVTPEQFKAARTALAKNWTVDSVLRGNDVDLNALSRIHENNPNLLTGPLRDLADFASKNKGVIGTAGRVEAPSVVEDLKNSINIMHPVKGAIEGATGALGRRLLTGGPAAGRAAAREAVPGRLGDEFAPIQPKPAAPGTVNFTPPEGAPPMAVAGEGAGGPHGPAPGPAGGIPLADVLSHGVERAPPAGLSVGPMGAPQGEGLPFRVNAEHAAGGLGLAPEEAWFHGGQPERLGDLAAVMSQGVPEGIMTRTAAPAAGTRSMRGPGTRLGDVLANNASGESAASQEAINRGTRDLVKVDPDGNETPVLRDVTQVDRSAPKGSLIVDRSSGEIVSRGGLNKQAAEGLRNRWASRQRLGDTFVSR